MDLKLARQEMNAALKQSTIPYIRKLGFKGSFPHFRRIRTDRIDLITFQFDKYGGGFVVEIAQAPSGDYETHYGKIIPPRKLTTHDIRYINRTRLGSNDEGEDYWFRYDETSKPRKHLFQKVAAKVIEHIEKQAIEYWEKGAEPSA